MSPRPEFAIVFRDHYPYVVRLAARVTGDAELAKDITQDVFIAVFQSLQNFAASLRSGPGYTRSRCELRDATP